MILSPPSSAESATISCWFRGIRRKDEGVLMMYKEFVVQLGGPVWDNAHMDAEVQSYLGLATEGLVMAPSDEAELINMVATTTTIDDRPRTRGAANGKSFHKKVPQMDEVENPLRHRPLRSFSSLCLVGKSFSRVL
ncbi:hypothetical protein Tco_0307794 [Tanacetum coccineum]